MSYQQIVLGKWLGLLSTAILLLVLAGCSLTDGDFSTTLGDTTLGNGRVDIELGDGRLLGNRSLYLASVTGLELAVFNDSDAAAQLILALVDVRDKVVEFDEYMASNEAANVLADALAGCGLDLCQTTLGKALLASMIAHLPMELNMLSQRYDQLSVKPVELLDAVIGAAKQAQRFAD